MGYHRIRLRNEKKYFISTTSQSIISERLKYTMKSDQHTDENREYTITSLYFDDMYETSYQQKLAGIKKRYKYRVRIYNHDVSKINFEKKIKIGEHVGKFSCPMTIDEYRALFTGENLHILLDSPYSLLHEAFVEVRTKRLSPRVVVEYDREVLISDAGNVRVTFDKRLRAGIDHLNIIKPTENLVSVIQEDKTIMEVKFDDFLPSHIRELIHVNDREYLSISKYVLCVDAMNLYGGNFCDAKHTIIPRHF